MQKGRLITQPALFYARGKGKSQDLPGRSDLLRIHNLEVLGRLIPLKYRRGSLAREIFHSYPATVQPYLKFSTDTDDPESIRLIIRQANLISVHKGFDPMGPRRQQIVVELYRKPNIGPRIPIHTTALSPHIHVVSFRAIRGGDGCHSGSVGIHNSDLDAVASVLTHPAPDESNATSGATVSGFL